MFNAQANTARFIYTISLKEPLSIDNSIEPTSETNNYNQKAFAKLKNGLYFTKEARSDEKVRYTETDIFAIIRTILFIYTFECEPENSLIEIINSGTVEYNLSANFQQINRLNIQIAKDILDNLFGERFTFITRRMVIKCLNEYYKIWQYYPFIQNIHCPSAQDIVKLARFVNASMATYSSNTLFLLENSTDNRLPLQSNTKILNTNNSNIIVHINSQQQQQQQQQKPS